MECVAKRIPPVVLPAVPAPADASKVYDFSLINEWCSRAMDWLEVKDTAKRADDASKVLKNMVPADAKKVFGAGVRITRDRAGRLSLREDVLMTLPAKDHRRRRHRIRHRQGRPRQTHPARAHDLLRPALQEPRAQPTHPAVRLPDAVRETHAVRQARFARRSAAQDPPASRSPSSARSRRTACCRSPRHEATDRDGRSDKDLVASFRSRTCSRGGAQQRGDEGNHQGQAPRDGLHRSRGLGFLDGSEVETIPGAKRLAAHASTQ